MFSSLIRLFLSLGAIVGTDKVSHLSQNEDVNTLLDR